MAWYLAQFGGFVVVVAVVCFCFLFLFCLFAYMVCELSRCLEPIFAPLYIYLILVFKQLFLLYYWSRSSFFFSFFFSWFVTLNLSRSCHILYIYFICFFICCHCWSGYGVSTLFKKIKIKKKKKKKKKKYTKHQHTQKRNFNAIIMLHSLYNCTYDRSC